jgi:NAD+--asparagine ADP-ribosyltransferase
MATALFIKRGDLVRNSILDGNIDTDKFIQFVKIAQEIHIRNYTGTDLYNKISADIIAGTLSGDYLELVNTYIQPMLIHYAMVDYLPFAAYQVKNGGVYKHISENGESVDKSEIDYLVNKQRDFAEYYTRRFIDYMNFNESSFPEYRSNTNDDIHPDNDATFNGWVL